MLVRGLAVPVVVVGVVVASFPFWTGRLYPEDFTFESIPRYWDHAFDYLAAQEQPSRVLVLPGRRASALPVGACPRHPLRRALARRAGDQSRPAAGDRRERRPGAAIDEYAASAGYVPGTLGADASRGSACGGWCCRTTSTGSRWTSPARPPTSASAPIRGCSLAATFGRRGQNTTAALDVAEAASLGELSLPPVEIYEVAGKPSPRPRLAAGTPLLVSGAATPGPPWPPLACSVGRRSPIPEPSRTPMCSRSG